MDNLFSRLGFGVKKASTKVEIPEHLKEEIERDKAALDELAEKDAVETSEMYHRMLPTEFVEELQKHNDYSCTQWGARKVARLLNISRNILDVEIFSEGRVLKEENREDVLRYLMFMCWLVPIPIKKYHTSRDVDVVYKEKMRKWLIEDFSLLTDMEAKLVLEGVFSRTNVKPGNPILDIFHDALRFEEMQFGIEVDPNFMRTPLGKNPVFRARAKKSASNNLTPHWMLYLQELKGLSLLDREKALEDEEYMGDDGIS